MLTRAPEDFLTDEQRMIRDTARDFARAELAPHAGRWEEEGWIPDEVYRPHPTIKMEEGDILIAYTDGLVEARDPANPELLFGEDGAKRVLAQAARPGATAGEICTQLVEAALGFSGGGREDDITVVVARRKARA